MANDNAYDVLIVGSGAAGMKLALSLPRNLRIGILFKRKMNDCNSAMAQGGIAAVLDEDDTIESHIADTMDAGAGLNDEAAVRFIVERGRAAVEELVDFGIGFTGDRGRGGRNFPFHLTREGGHSHRRVAHVADATGQAVVDVLRAQLVKRGNIDLFADHLAIDLIMDKPRNARGRRCVGLHALNIQTGHVVTIPARVTALATGGSSKVYLYTSNSDAATGDGIAMAWRAGCRVANMEFSQFHPTCLYHAEERTYLITEAMRGEGGRLLLPNGERFMKRFDARAELAPRDIVARAIDHEMKRLGLEYVHLDISHKPAAFVKEHFPTIHQLCLELGFDITKEPIPVVPAAHYSCGGVMTDVHGRTDLKGLYAMGEVTYTGLHGANRLASNSLLECLVMGGSAAEAIMAELPHVSAPPPLRPWDESWVTDSDEEIVVTHNWHELRRLMWNYVGIVRTTKRLERALRRTSLLQQEIREFYSNFRVTADLLELRNLAMVGELIIRSALARHESRGLHYTLDYPETVPGKPRPTILVPNREENSAAPALAGGMAS
jgi:L-aspartate oxidase